MTKILKRMFFLFILTVNLVGCSMSSGMDPKSDTPVISNNDISKETVTLKVWIMPNSEEAEKDFNDLIDPFLKANPSIKVNLKVIDWESAWNKIGISVTGGDAPDITQLGTTWVAAIASTGELVDLTSKYNEKDFLPQALSATVIEDKNPGVRYSMPWFIDTRILYYRKDACLKAGVDPTKDFATWDSYREALRKLNGIEIKGKKLAALGEPGKNDWDVVHNFSWWIWGFGGEFLTSDYKKSAINTPEAFKGIKYYTDLAGEGLMSKTALEKNNNEVRDLFFKEGEFATHINGPYRNIDTDKIGAVSIPSGPNGKYSFLGGSSLAIYKSSKHPEQALKLLSYLSSKEAQVEYSKKSMYLPVVKTAYDDPYIVSDPIISAFKSQVLYSKAYPSIADWGSVENVAQKGLSNIWDIVLGVYGPYSDEKLRDELNNTAEKMDEILQDND